MKYTILLVLVISLAVCSARKQKNENQVFLSRLSDNQGVYQLSQVCDLMRGVILQVRSDRAKFLNQLFEYYDENKDGYISEEEVKRSVPGGFDLRRYWESVDENNDGKITREENNNPSCETIEILRELYKENRC